MYVCVYFHIFSCMHTCDMYGKLQKDSLRPNSTKIVIEYCSILFTMQQGVPPADQASPTCGRTAIAAGRWGLVSRGDSENHWDLIHKWFMGISEGIYIWNIYWYIYICIYIGMNIEWYDTYIYIYIYTYYYIYTHTYAYIYTYIYTSYNPGTTNKFNWSVSFGSPS
jgi:hypothetical protein